LGRKFPLPNEFVLAKEVLGPGPRSGSMKGKFLVLDGNSLVHRAFHALPLLSTRQGVFTNAAYGFTTMLFKVLEQEKPTHVAVAFDKGRVTFRHAQYQEYKAQRKETPEQLRPQFDLVKRVLAAMRIPYFEVEGYEADDLIGTLVKQAEAAGLESVIVTADRDALQLVSARTRAMLTKKGISQLAVYDSEALAAEFGLEPSQVVDVKALMGDASDNIPGVPGIGEKTALRLIREYGSLEHLLAKAETVSPPSLAAKLVQYAEQARMSKELATIFCQVPLQVDWEDCRYRSPDYEQLLAVFQELEFRSLMKEVLEAAAKERPSPEPAKASSQDWAALASPQELASYLARLADAGRGAFALVFQGEDYFRAPVVALGLACPGAMPVGYAVSLGAPWDVLADFLSRQRVELFSHDAKAVLVALARQGLPPFCPAAGTQGLGHLRRPRGPRASLPRAAL